MARTDNFWTTIAGGSYLKTIFSNGIDILVNGTNRYLNFNAISGVSGYGFRDNGGVMEYKDSGGSWIPFSSLGGGGAVTSVFSRTGAVVAAAGDYNASQITNTPAGNIASVTVQGALNELDSEKADIGHTHSGLAPTGGAAGQVLKKNSGANYDYSWQADSTGGGGVSLTEVEIDFGTIALPITSWTITDAGVASSNKILVFPSPNPATGRAGNDWELDSAIFTAIAGTGNFVVNMVNECLMIGKRKIYYQKI